jgi:hypothetical protein
MLAGGSAGAQVLGEEAEMARLQSRAEEAAAAGDAEGAAMSMGKAALMAAVLAKDRTDRAGRYFLGAEALFRAQEHAYRALGLFQRAGGQPPASSGVCQTIRLATQYAAGAHERLTAVAKIPPSTKALAETPYLQQARRLQADAEDWMRIIEGMIGDFQCNKEWS